METTHIVKQGSLGTLELRENTHEWTDLKRETPSPYSRRLESNFNGEIVVLPTGYQIYLLICLGQNLV